MMSITEPRGEHIASECFFCSQNVDDLDVRVDGATACIRLHRRCAEAFGIGLIRAADSRRRPGRPELMAVA